MGTGGSYPPPFGHNAGPPPPPPDLQPIIDKTAEYVARNSEDFERTVLEKHCGDPKFGFLNPWNKFYPYYKLRLQQCKEKAAEEALATIERDFQRQETQKGEKIQKLSQTGTVSFKLQPKKVAKVLEMEVVDFGPTEDEEEEESRVDDLLEGRGQCVPEESYQTTEGTCTAEQGSTHDMGSYQYEDVTPPHNHNQSFPEDHVHYSAEGMYYYPNGNGECEEDQPAAKRAKTDADENTVVMDNKVQVNSVYICMVVSFICPPLSLPLSLIAGISESSESCIRHLALHLSIFMCIYFYLKPSALESSAHAHP